MKSIEKLVLAHRYLYYVKNKPVLSDRDYDLMEQEARRSVMADSPVNSPGSDRASDYPESVIELAEKLAA